MYLIHRVGLIRQIKLGPQKGLNTTSGALFAALPNEFLKVMFHLSDHRLSRIPEKKIEKACFLHCVVAWSLLNLPTGSCAPLTINCILAICFSIYNL